MKNQGLTAKKVRDALDIAREKRIASIRAADLIEKHISMDAHTNMLHCGDVLTMLEDEYREHRRLKSSFFCKQRLCPGCAYRASLANATMIAAISGALYSRGMAGIMVTLTAPNCQDFELSDQILRYNRAWHDLMKNEPYKSAWKHHIRKFEVTYNQQADTYHPHLHILIFVNPGYFAGHTYISRARLLKDWRRVMKDERITQVDIRRTYGDDWHAISELAKYVAKSGDYLTNQHVFDTFYTSLKGKRLNGYAGFCKELRAEYKKGNLREFIERDLTRYVWLVIYTDYQKTGNYIEETIKPYDSLIMGDEDIPVADLLPREWDELAD